MRFAVSYYCYYIVIIGSVVVLLITARTGATPEQPRFTWSSSESVTVVQGDNLTLECVAHGVPAPQLSWEKYGGHVPYGRHSLLLGKISIFFVFSVLGKLAVL